MFAIEKIVEQDLGNIHPLAVIESIGYAFEAPPSVTGIDQHGDILQRSMQMALDNMITPEPVDQLLLHGTGTIKGDTAEMNAVKQVFGEKVPNMFTNKWKLGHTYGASAALHLELACLMIKHNQTLDLPYANTLKNKPEKKIQKVMINATGFGGNAMSLIVSSPILFKNPSKV